jgi:hypothetical protein
VIKKKLLCKNLKIVFLWHVKDPGLDQSIKSKQQKLLSILLLQVKINFAKEEMSRGLPHLIRNLFQDV